MHRDPNKMDEKKKKKDTPKKKKKKKGKKKSNKITQHGCEGKTPEKTQKKTKPIP